MNRNIKNVLAVVASVWLIVQIGSIFWNKATKAMNDGMENRIKICEERIIKCSEYAPQCNPSIFPNVPEKETCEARIRDAVAKQKELGRQDTNKAYGSAQWYAKKYLLEMGSGTSVTTIDGK